MEAFIKAMRCKGIPAVFYFATIVCGVVVAHWKLLPLDTSSFPLAIVMTSQSCLIALWLVHHSKSWLGRILVPTVLVGLVAILRWAADGLPVPANMLWLSVYGLDGLVPLVGVTCCALLLSRTTKHAEIESPSNLRFSVADLLFVTTMCAIGVLSVMLSPPSLTQYQYTYGLRDTAKQIAASALPVVITTLIVFRIMQSPVLRIWALSSTILFTLIVGLVTAKLMGIHANPLWGSYALAPSLTTVLVALALLIHRHAVAHRQCCKHLVNSCDERPNNQPLHTEPRVARFVKSMSFAAAR